VHIEFLYFQRKGHAFQEASVSNSGSGVGTRPPAFFAGNKRTTAAHTRSPAAGEKGAREKTALKLCLDTGKFKNLGKFKYQLLCLSGG
jgi:hypothetical protein